MSHFCLHDNSCLPSDLYCQVALSRPILFSNWLSKDYTAVDQEDLRDYVHARLKVFYEEELDIPLVLFNEVLDHVLRIDRIFKQKQVCCVCVCACVCSLSVFRGSLCCYVYLCRHYNLTTTRTQGHLLLIGVSGAGKTTLSRFVAWINGLSVFQIKVLPKRSRLP